MSTKSSFTVIGNWKMNKTLPEVQQFLEQIAAHSEEITCTCGLAVPFTAIKFAHDLCSQDPRLKAMQIGAQNMNDASQGAFTGEIAGKMLIDAGAEFVLLGHSERRTLFHETDEMIVKKVQRAVQDNIPFILCIGETLEERNLGKTEEVLHNQLQADLSGFVQGDTMLCSIAYEPIWAIGTGMTPTAEEIEKVCGYIQKELALLSISAQLLYGGSVSSKNCDEFAKIPSVNGFLVGGSSLEPKEFMKIVGAKTAA